MQKVFIGRDGVQRHLAYAITTEWHRGQPKALAIKKCENKERMSIGILDYLCSYIIYSAFCVSGMIGGSFTQR